MNRLKSSLFVVTSLLSTLAIGRELVQEKTSVGEQSSTNTEFSRSKMQHGIEAILPELLRDIGPEGDRKRRREANRSANEAAVEKDMREAYKTKVFKLKAWLDCTDSFRNGITLIGCKADASHLTTLVNEVINFPNFQWTGGVKNLLKRAIDADTIGYAVIDILNALPNTEMTPGIVEAFLKILDRDPTNDFVLRVTGPSILRAINKEGDNTTGVIPLNSSDNIPSTLRPIRKLATGPSSGGTGRLMLEAKLALSRANRVR